MKSSYLRHIVHLTFAIIFLSLVPAQAQVTTAMGNENFRVQCALCSSSVAEIVHPPWGVFAG
jgi:hypothetical protein